MLNVKVWTWALGTWATVTYLVCVLWGVVTPEALHMHQLLETVLPGFRWLSPGGFLVGLVESFLYGAYAGLLLVPVHNFYQRRFGTVTPTRTGPAGQPIRRREDMKDPRAASRGGEPEEGAHSEHHPE